MIICGDCKTARFLRLTDAFTDFEDGELKELRETYECVMCDGTGEYLFSIDVELTNGVVERTDAKPRSMCWHKRRAKR